METMNEMLNFYKAFWNDPDNNIHTSGKTVEVGDICNAVAGTLTRKFGKATGINTRKTEAITITTVQGIGVRFKTLA